jgi:hypothetical protein
LALYERNENSDEKKGSKGKFLTPLEPSHEIGLENHFHKFHRRIRSRHYHDDPRAFLKSERQGRRETVYLAIFSNMPLCFKPYVPRVLR